MSLQRLTAVLLASSAIAASACSTATTVTSVWKDPTYAAGPLRKVCVFARTPSEATRRNAEDAFVSALDRRGVQGTQSYRIVQQGMDRDAIRQLLQSEGYDGALVLEFLGVLERTSVDPGAGFGRWDHDYYVHVDRLVGVQTTLWDPHSSKLVWSATTQTENPLSSSDATTSLVSKLVSELEEARFIPPAP